MAESCEQWCSSAEIAPVAALLCSPYRSTRETAEVLADVFHPNRLEVLDTLAPGARLEIFSE